MGWWFRKRHGARHAEAGCHALALLERDGIIAGHEDRAGLAGALPGLS